MNDEVKTGEGANPGDGQEAQAETPTPDADTTTVGTALGSEKESAAMCDEEDPRLDHPELKQLYPKRQARRVFLAAHDAEHNPDDEDE